MSYLKNILGIVASAALSLPAVANAQPSDTDPGEASGNPDSAGQPSPGTAGTDQEGNPLPAATSDDDPQPEAAAVIPPDTGVVEQAGVGGATAYGRHGVLELGGSIGFTAATDFKQFSFTPSIGWFLADNLQLSALINLQYVKLGDLDAGTAFTGLIEPSYHVPFSNTVFGFLGIGAGLGYTNAKDANGDDVGVGFTLQPRAGANFLVGRSGILTPALFYGYTTSDAVTLPDGRTLVAVSASYGLQVGYTVMW